MTDNDFQRAVTDHWDPIVDAAHIGVTPMRRAPIPSPCNEALAELLVAAEAALGSDLDAVRVSVARAAALLQASQERQPAEARSVSRGGLAAWQAKRVAAYVDANFATTIRADDLAAVARLSTSHFFRAFHDTFGETPFTYVARRRMRHAQELMLHSGESLAEIALACGLCDQAHFTRVFRRIVGMTPRAWRRQFATEPAGSSGVDLHRRRPLRAHLSSSSTARGGHPPVQGHA